MAQLQLLDQSPTMVVEINGHSDGEGYYSEPSSGQSEDGEIPWASEGKGGMIETRSESESSGYDDESSNSDQTDISRSHNGQILSTCI